MSCWKPSSKECTAGSTESTKSVHKGRLSDSAGLNHSEFTEGFQFTPAEDRALVSRRKKKRGGG